MLKFKDGVIWQVGAISVQPEALRIISAVESVMERYGFTCTVTSVMDGYHSRNSLHYKGMAVDFRIWNMENVIDEIVFDVKQELGKDYDVVLERTHLHVEFDPKD